MSYIRKHLMTGEVVAMETRLSGIVYIPALTVFILAVGLYLALWRTGSTPENALPLPGVLVLVALVLALRGLYKRHASEFAATNKRVVVKTGLMRQHSSETLLRQVEGITVDQGLLGRILDYGTIVIEGTGTDKVPYAGIAHPQRFRLTVLEQIEKNLAPQAPVAPGPVAASRGDNYDALVKMNALKQRGIMTDEEFQREKRRILG